MGTTLDRLLERRDGDTVALVDGDRRLTAGEVRARVARLACGLRARGVDRGDVVAWQLPNWWEAVVLLRACWALGAVAAPLHHRGGARDVARQLELLAPKLVLAAPGLPAGGLEVRGDGAFEALLDGPATGGAENARPGDPAVVLFTSGSTEGPKGVVHTHRSLGHKARTMPAVHGLTGGDAVLVPAPLAHVSGLLNGVLLPGAAGMKAVLMDRWDPSAALDLVAAERVTFLAGPPTFVVGLLEAPGFGADRVASLRLVSCGGTGVTRAFVEHAAARLDAQVKRTYGSTEAPTVTTWHDGDPPHRAATTDGRPTPATALRITGAGRGGEVAVGAVGEVWVRGPELFAGYLGRDPGEAFAPGGWFRTGDLGVVDADGWLTIVGRSRELIIRGGENIAPAPVEEALEAHPAVRRAVVVGLPDERLGEVVGAVVVADGGFDLDACRRWCADQGLARFQAPSHLLRVESLPLLGSGKPDRRAARRLLEGAT